MKSDRFTGSPAGSKTATPRSLPSSTTIRRVGAKVVLLTVALAALRPYVQTTGTASAQSPPRFLGPTSSQPLALSADDSRLVVANPDNNRITVFDTAHNNLRLFEITVGKEPNGVAISPEVARIHRQHGGRHRVRDRSGFGHGRIRYGYRHGTRRHGTLRFGAHAIGPEALCRQRAVQYRIGDRYLESFGPNH